MWYRYISNSDVIARRDGWSDWIRVDSNIPVRTGMGSIWEFTDKAPVEPFKPGLFRETSGMHHSTSVGQMVRWFDFDPTTSSGGGLWERVQ